MDGYKDAERWYGRAEEVLVRMEEAKNERTREILVRIYWDYLRLARLAEEQADSKSMFDNSVHS